MVSEDQRSGENPFSSIRSCLATQPHDQAADHRDAWVFGIVFGWDEALDRVRRRHHWSDADVARLLRLRRRFLAAERLLELSHEELQMAITASSLDGLTTLLEIRPVVLHFAMAMEVQLRANAHKGGWEDDSADALMARLREETEELENSLLAARQAREVGRGGVLAPRPRGTILRDAADVANFAMMIADVEEGEQTCERKT